MEYLGHVRDGVIVLDDGVTLPEGRTLTVSCGIRIERKSAKKGRVTLPLVKSQHPGSLRLTNKRIAEIFEEEDLACFGRFFDPPST